MSDLDKAFLEAVPACAGRLLVIGSDLMAHRALWEMRNPLLAIDMASGPWSRPIPAEKGPKADAILLGLDAVGDEAAAAVARALNCLAPESTLALVGAAGDTVIASLTALLQEKGCTFERRIETGTAQRIVRFQFTERPWPRIRVNADPFLLNDRPLNQSLVRVRLREPFEQLNSLPFMRCEVGPENQLPSIADSEGAKIHLIQRKYFHDPDGLVRMAGANNFLTVLETDDMFVETDSVPFALYRKNVMSVHAVQTSTPYLAEHLRQFHPEVAVFGNHLARIRPLQPRETGPTVRIVFAGINRQAGWGQIVEAYREVVARHQDRVTTVVVGDRDFAQKLRPLPVTFLPTIPHADYLAELGKSDVALLPLADTPFDRGKTDLKFIECAEAGAVVLASHVVYGDTVKPGKTGFVYRNADEFKRHLSALILEPANRAKMARQAHRYVGERRALGTHIRRQQEWYRSLVERRDELEQARRRRVEQG